MTFLPNFSKGNFVPENFEIPTDPVEFRIFLKRVLERHAKTLNRKDTAQYETVEIQNNQTFPGDTPQNKRYIFRKLVDLGTLSTGVNNIAHGISVGTPSTYVFTRIYGTVYNQTTPLFVSAPNDTIHLEVNATQVSITIPAAYNGYSAICVLEFYKN